MKDVQVRWHFSLNTRVFPIRQRLAKSGYGFVFILQISPVRTSDQGFYQCQVNTEPKQSRTVVLVVLGKAN